jgi:hypothetical protein
LLAPLLASLAVSFACPAAAESPARSDDDVSRRLAFIRERIDRGTGRANLWWYGWYGGYTALTLGQAIGAVATTNRGTRVDLAFGAVASSLGVVPLGILGFPPGTASATLRAMPEATPEERRRKLARAERLLEASAGSEAFGRSWVAHAAGGVIGLASFFALTFGYKRLGAGILNLVGGVAITEAQIFTGPTAAIDAFQQYRALSSSSPPRPISWRPILQPGGAGIGASF